MTLTALVIVLGAAAWFFGARRLRRPVEDRLRVVSRAGLTQRAGLALVELEGRRLLVGYGEGAPALLLECGAGPAPIELEEVVP